MNLLQTKTWRNKESKDRRDFKEFTQPIFAFHQTFNYRSYANHKQYKKSLGSLTKEFWEKLKNTLNL